MAVRYQDYYEILGVAKNADQKEIKSAYKKLARQWHPDLHTGEKKKKEAEDKFKKINEAYEVLSDPDKRAKYDRLGDNWRNGDEFTPPPEWGDNVHFYTSGDFDINDLGGFSDFFASLFGDRRRTAYSDLGGFNTRFKQGQDLESEIEISLEDAFHGGKKAINIETDRACSICQGHGFVDRGFCSSCGGTGSKTETRNLEVKIPAGVKEDSVIRLRNQGEEGYGGGKKGDLLLRVKIRPHPVFTLKGYDLESDLVLRPEQAVLGDRISVETIDGKINVNIPAGSHSGQKLRLKNKGMPKKDGTRGDHYLKLKIDIPRSMGEEEKQLYEKIKELHRK